MKTNIAELLKDCPKGMELDSALFEGLEFDSIVDDHFLPIRCRIKHPDGGYHIYNFTKHGCWPDVPFAKCVIFPKGKTTWEGFVPPVEIKDGDVIAMENACGVHIFIYNNTTDEDGSYGYYVIFTSLGRFKINSFCSGRTYRLATEEEKQKLFQAIKDNGYKWNPETKTLDKLPKFKVGNRIKEKEGEKIAIVERVYKNHYDIRFDIDGGIGAFTIDLQDEWELVPNKFDITTLKAFESRVLIRDYDNQIWIPTFWGKYLEDDSNCRYLTTNGCYKYCIPYEGNEHLLGKSNNCDPFFKTWEK